MGNLILALDFGGTKLAAGVAVQGERAWRGHTRVLSPPHTDAGHDRAAMLAMAKELLASERPAAVGVSFGGPVDYTTGIVRLSHHVPGWESTPLKQILETEFNAPAWVDNDANVAALGEYRFGAGQGADSMLYITVSTGVGGGWILNGRPWRGHAGMAGEIGHMVVDPHGPLCLCGKQGCVERLASGPYIASRAREVLALYPERGRKLRALVQNDLHAVDAKRVAEAAAQGDGLAWEVLSVAARALGVGIGNTANLINPQRFVLGGGVTKSGERFWEAVRRTAREIALPQVHFEIVPAALGDDAPLWGAVALAGP